MCALLANSTLNCWGLNDQGQVGGGTISSPGGYLWSPVPVLSSTMPVTTASGFIRVVSDCQLTCGFRPGKQIECWGHNDHGQLGTGYSFAALPGSAVPVNVNTAP